MRATRLRRLGVPMLPLLAAIAAGCGAEPAPTTNPQIIAPQIPPDVRIRRVDFRAAGMRLSIPDIGRLERRPSPGVFRVSFGTAFVAAFAYPRRELIPRGPAELAVAERRLVRLVRRRDPRLRLIRARTTRAAGAPAIELVADQTLARSRLRTRSLHVFKGRAEYVLELLAPIASFRSANRHAFSRMVRSLRVRGSVRSRGGGR